MASQYYKLTRNEIDFIKDDVKKSEITFSHLEDELVDHLCCMVEEMVNDGYSFEAAVEAMRKDVGMDTLKSIEVETIILINKKFQAMKKTLKISGIIGLSAIAISSLMKIMHWPGASLLLIVGFAALLLAYLPALSLTLQKEKILKRKIHLSYVGMAAASILLLSLLFSIMHWPFGDYLRITSWLSMLVFLVMLFNNVMKSEEDRVLNLSMLLFFAILFIINIAFFLFDIKNPRISKLTIETNIEATIKLYDHKSEKIYQQLDGIVANPKAIEITEIKTKTANITSQIEEIRNALFASRAEQENFNTQILKKHSITTSIEDLSWKLESDVKAYHDFMLSKSISLPELNSFIDNSIQFGWLEISNNPPTIYNNLQRLYRDIKMAESELLGEIQQSMQPAVKN